MAIRIYNTLTRRKEDFVPMTPGVVNMFVCGPTVYDYSHLGHAKTYTHFDFVARYLKKRGYAVTYAQNITDIDDKIISRANELGMDPGELAEKYEALYLADMAALHNDNVDIFARARDYIDAIVAQVQTLIERGHAYQLDDGWYFDLSTFPGYGKLSGRTEVQPEDAQSRVDEHPGKRNPGDFALWKARKPGEPYWDTPLGEGRPGWHIEDTAITESLFGPQYDLHGGAVDLIFPHHEAEVTQMEAASGKEPMVRYWMHGGFLRVDGNRMGKSLGNATTISGFLQVVDVRTLRYAFLSQHYRTSIELSEVTLDNARSARRRVENFARSIDSSAPESPSAVTLADAARARFFERLDDDFDAPGALAALFDYIRDQNRSGEKPGLAAYDLVQEVEELFDAFDLEEHKGDDAAIEGELEQRRALRAARQFAEADAVRDSLQARGIVIEDTPDGTRWWYEER